MLMLILDPVLEGIVSEPRPQFANADNPDRPITRNFAQGSSAHHTAQLIHEVPTIFPAPQIALG